MLFAFCIAAEAFQAMADFSESLVADCCNATRQIVVKGMETGTVTEV